MFDIFNTRKVNELKAYVSYLENELDLAEDEIWVLRTKLKPEKVMLGVKRITVTPNGEVGIKTAKRGRGRPKRVKNKSK